MLRLLSRFSPTRHARSPADAGPDGDAPAADEQALAGTSRRSLITRGLSLLAGAAGLTAAGALVQSGSRPSPVATPTLAGQAPVAAVRPTELALFVRDIRFTSPSLRPGELPSAKVYTAPHGELIDASGTRFGTMSGGILPGSGGEIAFQRFVFANGTLIGMGSGSLDHEEYAVVGGTGAYAGAVGTYQTKLQLGTRGRDAEFTFNVTGVR